MAITEHSKAASTTKAFGPWFKTTEYLPRPEQDVLVLRSKREGHVDIGVAHLFSEGLDEPMIWYSWNGEACIGIVQCWKLLEDDLPQPYSLWKAQDDMEALQQSAVYLQDDVERAQLTVNELREEAESDGTANDRPAESVSVAVASAAQPTAQQATALTPEATASAHEEAEDDEEEDAEDIRIAEMEHWIEYGQHVQGLLTEAAIKKEGWISVETRLPEKEGEEGECFLTYHQGDFSLARWEAGDHDDDWFFWGIVLQDQVKVSHWRPTKANWLAVPLTASY